MSRDEFSKSTKLEAFTRCGGKCEGCGGFLRPGWFDFDHDKPAAFGGGATLQNCKVLCKSCHRGKTSDRDVPQIAKSNRIRARQAGIRKKSKFACSRDSKLKKKVSGEVVAR